MVTSLCLHHSILFYFGALFEIISPRIVSPTAPQACVQTKCSDWYQNNPVLHSLRFIYNATFIFHHPRTSSIIGFIFTPWHFILYIRIIYIWISLLRKYVHTSRDFIVTKYMWNPLKSFWNKHIFDKANFDFEFMYFWNWTQFLGFACTVCLKKVLQWEY